MIEKIKILRKQGLKISLDDFGKASSNLLRLTKLPIDIVKLDKSLITDVGRDHKSRLAVRGISSIAKEMGMTVIAEGVKQKNKLDALVNKTSHRIKVFCIQKQNIAQMYSKRQLP